MQNKFLFIVFFFGKIIILQFLYVFDITTPDDFKISIT